MTELVTDTRKKGVRGLLESQSELAGLGGHLWSRGRGQTLTKTLQGSGWYMGTKGREWWARQLLYKSTQVQGEESLLRNTANERKARGKNIH